MDTKLIKNIVRGGSRVITANTTGAWYRLGYAERASDFYGEFLVSHNWGNNAPDILKIIVGCATNTLPSCMIKEAFCSCIDTSQSPPNKNTLVPKARVVYYNKGGTDSYNIYVDVFIKNNGTWAQGSNTWSYSLSRELYPSRSSWKDCAFGDADIPSSIYAAKEFAFV